MDSTLYWLWLAEALGSGCRLASRLLEEYPDPAELYGQVKAGWNPPEYLSAKAREFMQAVAPAQMAGLKKRCDDLNIFILTPDSADYPQRLRDLPDLPLVLYGTGNPACLNGRRYAGMVGTRRPSTYGRQAAFDLSLAMARAGVVLVSGLADGLDSEAHRAAVQADVPTVAFLGTAIDKTYPASNAKLRTAIEKGGGAVCSEYPPGYSGRTTGTFLARHRLIAAQREALCVAAAPPRPRPLARLGRLLPPFLRYGLQETLPAVVAFIVICEAIICSVGPSNAKKYFHIGSFTFVFWTRSFGLIGMIVGYAAAILLFDIMKIAMIRVGRRFREEGIRAKVILQVHDELVVDMLRSEQERVIAIVTEAMESAAALRVRLVVDCGVGDNWLEAH